MKFNFDNIGFLFGADKRQKLVKRLAKENHWSFTGRRNYTKDPIHTFDFQVFEGKPKKRLQSIVTFKVRALSGGFRIYDCDFIRDLGGKTTTVFEYYRKDMTLAPFIIKPKSGGFLKGLFGEEEAPVILTATPEFLENYQIDAPDHFKLKENLTEEFLDRLGDDKDWTVEGKQSCLIYYQHGDQLAVTKILERLEVFVHLVYDLENGKAFLS